MNKNLFITATVLLTGSFSWAVERDSLSIGLSGSYGNHDALGGEMYMGKQVRLFGRSAETKIGLKYRPYALSVDRVAGLEAASAGIFADLAMYPFGGTGLFVGLRWEMINLNRLSGASMSRFEQERGFRPSSLYTGTCVFLQAGYRFRLSEGFGLRLYGQPGIQQFRVGSGSFTSGSYEQQDPDGRTFSENQNRFIYNVNLGIEIRLR